MAVYIGLALVVISAIGATCTRIWYRQQVRQESFEDSWDDVERLFAPTGGNE
jgi:hypothetical protein